MTQQQALVLALKIGVSDSLFWIVAWLADYTRITRGEAWRNPIGVTLVLAKAFLAGTLLLVVISLFLRLDRTWTLVFTWCETVFLSAIGPVMFWRIVAFRREQRRGDQAGTLENG